MFSGDMDVAINMEYVITYINQFVQQFRLILLFYMGLDLAAMILGLLRGFILPAAIDGVKWQRSR